LTSALTEWPSSRFRQTKPAIWTSVRTSRVHRSHVDGVRDWPEPFGALAGTLPELEIDDIKAARSAALQGKAR